MGLRAYMQNTTVEGPYRYETAIPGDREAEWGQITEEIKCEPLKSVSVDIDDISSKVYGLTDRTTSIRNYYGDHVHGYIIERTVSGGDLTVYSVKIQPDRFYKETVREL